MTRVVVSERLHADADGRQVDPLKRLPHVTADLRLAWIPGVPFEDVERHARESLESVLRQARRSAGG